MLQISSLFRIPLDAGIPEGATPFWMIHCSCPSAYDCTSSEAREGTGGVMRAANGTPVA